MLGGEAAGVELGFYACKFRCSCSNLYSLLLGYKGCKRSVLPSLWELRQGLSQSGKPAALKMCARIPLEASARAGRRQRGASGTGETVSMSQHCSVISIPLLRGIHPGLVSGRVDICNFLGRL